MKRRSFCEWIPILPWPVWPLAWQRVLGQNTVVGSMTLLLAMRGNIVTRSMSGPPFALQLHCTTVWCRVPTTRPPAENHVKTPHLKTFSLTQYFIDVSGKPVYAGLQVTRNKRHE